MKDHKVDMNAGSQDVLKKMPGHSSYGQPSSAAKKWMTVTEMGNLLGLKKTDRYWLVHKNVFETKELLGKLRINVDSFEKWYANQIKYHKVTGEEPGKELKERSYSIRDIADRLELSESTVYELIQREHIETIMVDYWKRVPKETFKKWYEGQDRTGICSGKTKKNVRNY